LAYILEYLNAINNTLFCYITLLILRYTTIKICDDSRSRSKRSKRIAEQQH